ncbi:hypothetical protein GTR04_2358 [Trichophyton interdigitale]|uniref:Uncharacterized protein n=1 Tax=Trichophyton interdigitale TaxID=101480 RepID=A0A9P5CWL7_9EURO|nr:hypothetical protein GY632_1964 [Trichophyton interdigitale]KAF3900539.1 hypothetical protein GY631_0004 [Trichophyton interdigitale]KAG8210291.1 hypothetical protein GTR04_2358 [Trichophyton interdigitale]
MAKNSKRAPKAKAFAPSDSSAKSSSKSDSFDVPAAFTQAPSSLKGFLEPLSTNRIYLIHIDTHPPGFKRQIFLVPLSINIVIVAFILYRIYTGLHMYPDIFNAVVSGTGPAKIDTASASWGFLSSTLAWRTLNFLLDYILATIFLPWPVRFFLGPIRWRLAVRFEAQEIIVRQSREWSESLRPGTWIRDDEATMKDRVIPAILPLRLQKTGYLLIDADWDMDCDAMINAHKVVESKKAKLEDFHTAVLVHGGPSKGWLIWRVEDEAVAASGETLPPAARDRIIAFKEKLTDMGKEDLFYRWVEIIQYESTRPGGFTPERQRSAMIEVKELFEKEGVDFDQFWKDIGGMEGVTL